MLIKKIYQWKGINGSGEKITDVNEALNRYDLKQILSNKNILLLSQKCITNKNIQKKIRTKYIDDFLYRFYSLVKAEVSIIDSLNLLLKIINRIEISALIYQIKLEIEKGKLLSEALLKFPKFFNQTVCTLIRLSENSNQLPIMLEKILLQRKKIHFFQQKIKKAMIYPVFVLLTTIIVFILLLKFIMPNFENLYTTFHVSLPLLTRIMLNLSNLVQKYSSMVCFLCIIFIIGIILNKKFSIFNINFQNIFIKIPYIKTLIHFYVIYYWCYSMAEMIKAGLPLLKALALAEKLSHYPFYQKKFKAISFHLKKGDLLHTALEKSSIFSKDILGFIQIAEQTGKLNETLNETAAQYHIKLNNRYEQLNRFIEPVMTLFIALITGIIVIALYLPVFNLGELF